MEDFKEAWGKHYINIKKNLDNLGWYDGRNDKTKRVFDEIETESIGRFQRPVSLRDSINEELEKSPKINLINKEDVGKGRRSKKSVRNSDGVRENSIQGSGGETEDL